MPRVARLLCHAPWPLCHGCATVMPRLCDWYATPMRPLCHAFQFVFYVRVVWTLSSESIFHDLRTPILINSLSAFFNCLRKSDNRPQLDPLSMSRLFTLIGYVFVLLYNPCSHLVRSPESCMRCFQQSCVQPRSKSEPRQELILR